MGDLSAHFSRSEFRCHGFGHAGHPDHPTRVEPALVATLEQIRAITGRPLKIVSGHRCAWWNAKVGGARLSQHLVGKAADIPPGRATRTQASQRGAIGTGTKGQWVIHVDVRSGRRATWVY